MTTARHHGAFEEEGIQLDLHGAYLRRTDLSYANLEKANLSGADFTNANLHGANLKDANLAGTILRGADMRNTRNLTARQLKSAIIDERTKLPVVLEDNPGIQE